MCDIGTSISNSGDCVHENGFDKRVGLTHKKE